MKDEIVTAIKKLIEKSKTSEKAGDAMQYSQAVLNLMHALATMDNIKR